MNRTQMALPWTNLHNEDSRFYIILAILTGLAVMMSVLIHLTVLPEPDRAEQEKLPPNLARIILEKKQAQPKPVPPPPVEQAEEEPELAPEPKPEPKEEPKVEPKPETKPLAKPEIKRDQEIKKAREKVRKTGLLALSDDLADMRESLSSQKISKQQALTAQTVAVKATGLSKASASSAVQGLQQVSGSVAADGVETASRQITQLEERDSEAELAQAEDALKVRIRSDESIARVIRDARQSLDALYNRALRNDPFIEGVIELELVIEASGEVSYVRVVSSELNNTELENKMANRLRLVNFGADNVERRQLTIPLRFVPP